MGRIVKVSELSGALLDSWVARARGIPPEHICIRPLIWGSGGVPICHATARFGDEGDECMRPFRPSTNWDQGGPIIEREKLIPAPISSDEWTAEKWHGAAKTHQEMLVTMDGPTLLIAAMRCFVALKYGDTVPDDPAQ